MVVASQSITVKLGFGEPSGPSADPVDALSIDTPKDGTDSIYVIKEKIAKAAGGAVRPEDLLLSFGPTDRKLGAQFVGDPTVDERALTLDKFSILAWLERFPHWGLTVRLLPPTPPAPGVAIQQAAAAAEQKNVAEAVQDARARGEIPKISELPAPWGPVHADPAPREALVGAGYYPPTYPTGSSPLVDSSA